MNDELKPCPFCGGEARLSEDKDYQINKRVETSPFKKYELEFIIKVLLHDSVAKQTVDIMRVNIIRKCQKLIKDSPLELLSVDKIALDRLLKRGEND